jgi:O-phospho-L-seryl-tRNASec:L-selenocysteinyl-tRNA synthase
MEKSEIEASFRALSIPQAHTTVGLSNLIHADKAYRSLFVNRRMPDEGWSDVTIQHLLYTLSTLDTNHKTPAQQQHSSRRRTNPRWCGVGEREGRVFSGLVASRHFGLSHGIGRSGDITEAQPKAVGSSVLAKLTLLMVLDLVRRGSGLDRKTAAAHGVLVPMCTGMTAALVLSSFRQAKGYEGRDVVLWSRIDQKSCLKAVQSAGLQCIVVPTRLEGDEVRTDVDALQSLLEEHQGRVLAVLTTTSCFAPRGPDAVDRVARLCQQHEVHHLVNHAYGLQSAVTNKLLNRACTVGRVDAIVCSTDKNFLVPVGGALVLSPHAGVTTAVGQIYAGRASAAPLVDLFITLLSMGLQGYQDLLRERNELLETFADRLHEVAAKHGERLLRCPTNNISFGITLQTLERPRRPDEDEATYRTTVNTTVSSFGAMLFNRCVSGTRVVPRGVTKSVCGVAFDGFGSSYHQYPYPYMTAACAIGLGAEETTLFFRRLDKCLGELKKKQEKKKQQAAEADRSAETTVTVP